MKGTLVVLSVAALFALSFGQLEESDLEELCGVPSYARRIILDCVIESMDSTSRRLLRETEQCAGVTLTDALQELCMLSTDKLEKLAGCDRMGDREPTINEQQALSCAQTRLGGRK